VHPTIVANPALWPTNGNNLAQFVKANLCSSDGPLHSITSAQKS
jgi:hypothetical protein